MKLYYFLKVMQLFSVYRGYDMDIRKIEENNRPTVNNVSRFFKNGKYDKYLNIATAASGITSIDFTKNTSKTTYTDHMEKMYLKAIDAQKIIKSVNEAIDLLPSSRLKTILIRSCLKREYTYNIYAALHIERSQFFTLKRYAMYLFADLFLIRQLANGVSSPIDLTADNDGC